MVRVYLGWVSGRGVSPLHQGLGMAQAKTVPEAFLFHSPLATTMYEAGKQPGTVF